MVSCVIVPWRLPGKMRIAVLGDTTLTEEEMKSLLRGEGGIVCTRSNGLIPPISREWCSQLIPIHSRVFRPRLPRQFYVALDFLCIFIKMCENLGKPVVLHRPAIGVSTRALLQCKCAVRREQSAHLSVCCCFVTVQSTNFGPLLLLGITAKRLLSRICCYPKKADRG